MPKVVKKQSKISASDIKSSETSNVRKKKTVVVEAPSAVVLPEEKVVEIVKETIPAIKKEINAIIDIEEIKKEIYASIKQQIRDELQREKHVEETKAKAEALVSRSELVLVGEKTYRVTGSTDGLAISKDKITMLNFTPSGSIGFNTNAPKATGPGSVHIKSNYNSEASLPTNGKGSVRGLLLESDADDQNSFLLRAVSRRNRQGLNLTGDGSLSLGLMHDDTKSRLNVYQPFNDRNAIHSYTPSRFYHGNMIDLETQATSTKQYNFLEAKNQSMENGDTFAQKVFKVDGTGSMYTDKTVHSNGTGYAEMFEWADGNPRKEDRTGYIVSLSPKGKLVMATEDDEILGVVSKNPAVVGNAAWNKWHGKYFKSENHNDKELRYHVMEWEAQDNTMESYFNSTLDKDFIPPDNTVVYETHTDGSDMYTGHQNAVYNREQEYNGRPDRTEWDPVVLHGSAVVCKGQITGKQWLKLADITDDLERWLIK